LIEPNPRIAEKARDLHRNRPGVAVATAACSDRAGTVDLVDYLDDSGGGHAHLVLGPGTRGARATDARRQIPTSVRRLDALLEEQAAPPDYGVLSIDTEGHDREVLLGAGLDRYRPRVIITEHGPAEAEKDALLRTQSYSLFRRLRYDSVWRRA
jgi:FkbM family methyltransferase